MALPVRRSSETTDDIGRSDPLVDLERLNQQLASHLGAWRQLPSLLSDGFTPLADVEETDDAYLVEIELAGVKKDDIDIEIAGRRISVRGERKEKERVGILRRRERVVGRFAYEVTLPGDVDDTDVSASFDDGVLTIRVAKPEHARPRRIAVA